MTEPSDTPPLCHFAEALVIPRMERIEADLAVAERSLDAAHAQMRTLSADVQTVSLEHAEHRRKIANLEANVIDIGKEVGLLRVDVSDLKVKLAAIFDRIHDLAVGQAGQSSDIKLICQKIDAQQSAQLKQHSARMKLLVTILALSGGIFGFFAMAHEAVSGHSLAESVGALLGIVK